VARGKPHLPPILGLHPGRQLSAAVGSTVKQPEDEGLGSGLCLDLVGEEAVRGCPSELQAVVVEGEGSGKPRVWHDEGEPRGVVDADGAVGEGNQEGAERVALWEALAHGGGEDVGDLKVETVCLGGGGEG
jgi:hypothetical protein